MNSSSMIVGPELLKLFGISDVNVTSFSINCSVDKDTIIYVKYLGALKEDKSDFETIIKNFVITEKSG